nr:hypothetical protein [Tanacetum cinerariifolium]
FRETPKVLTQAWDKFFEIQHAQPEDIHELLRKLLKDLQIINEELAEYINSPSWNRPAFYDDDDDDEYSIQVSEKSSIAIAPILPTEEPNNSLSMRDEHLETILKMELDEVIKSSVEDLVPIPSKSEGILDNMCDVPFSDKNHFDAESDLIESLLTRDTSIVYSPKIDSLLEEFADELAHIDPIPPGNDETDSDPKDDIGFIEQLLYDDTSSKDDSFKDIDYVEASPPNSELASLEEVKDEILRAKLLNNHLFIDKIESLNNNPTPDCVLKVSFAMEAILREPCVYVPNVLPTHLTLYQDSNFSNPDDSLGFGLEVSFPSEIRNKIFDLGIFIEVQFERPFITGGIFYLIHP